MNQELRTYEFQDFLAMDVVSLFTVKSQVSTDNTKYKNWSIYTNCEGLLQSAAHLLILSKLDDILAKKMYSAGVDAFLQSLPYLGSNQRPEYYTHKLILAGLLSDDSSVLKRIGDQQLNSIYKEPKPFGPLAFQIAQYALNQNYDDDFLRLVRKLVKLEQALKNEGRGPSLYFLSLAGKNEKKCEAEILKLIQDEPKRDMASFGPNYYNMEITGLVKLAHHNGLMVDIEHPMIDKRLLAFESLDAYPDCLEAIELLAPFHKPYVWSNEVHEEVPETAKKQDNILKKIGKWLKF